MKATRDVDGAPRPVNVYSAADVDLLDHAIEEILGAPPSRAGVAGETVGILHDHALPSAGHQSHSDGDGAIDLTARLDDVHEGHSLAPAPLAQLIQRHPR
jgi:hypothetical protein